MIIFGPKANGVFIGSTNVDKAIKNLLPCISSFLFNLFITSFSLSSFLESNGCSLIFLIYIINKIPKFIFSNLIRKISNGDWGLGIGDW